MYRSNSIACILIASTVFGILGCSTESDVLSDMPPDPLAHQITEALRRDDQIQQTLDPQPDWRVDEYVRLNVANMQSIDTMECPDDFARAYKKHLKTWQEHLRTVMDHTAELATLQDYFHVTTLYGTDARNELEEDVFADLDAIQSSFNECLRVAESYGVTKADFQADN